MEIIVPKSSGFCPGVKRAEDGVFQLKEKTPKVNLHGPLIHNQIYTSMLESKGIETVDIESLPEGETLVIRTHGISMHEEKKLAQKFVLKDLTCPIVKRVQKHIEKAAHEESFVIISGKEGHAEVQGLVSYAKDHIVIETENELEKFLKDYKNIIPENYKQIFILSQTTHSRIFFEHICDAIKNTITHIPVVIKDTICAVTENKEKESLELQKTVDWTIVIGDPHSSNSKKLYTILKKASENTLFTKNLVDLQEIKDDWVNTNKVLVVSSASTPLFIEQEIVAYLKNI